MTAAPASPPVRLSPPWTLHRVLVLASLAALAAATGYGATQVGLSPGALVAGVGDIGRLLARMLPPRFTRPADLVGLAVQTFWMAVAGTVLAVVIGLPLALLAARNTAPHRLVAAPARAVIVAARAVPDLVYALVFVRALGIGPLPGVLALGLHSVGMTGKLFADAIERIDPGPVEAAEAAGATRLQWMTGAVLPQIVPSIVSTGLYRLDINFRSSVILGLVGAGGLGQLLKTYFGALRYPEAMGVTIVIMVTVGLVEILSNGVRRAVLGGRSSAAPTFDPVTVRPTLSGDRLRLQTFTLAVAVATVIAFWKAGATPADLARAVTRSGSTVVRFVPPDFTTYRHDLITGVRETLTMAVVATALGSVAGVPAGLLAARNVAPFRWVQVVVRVLIAFVRAIPELAMALVFVAGVGLGPFAGTLALTVFTVGFVAKLVADAAEEIAPGPAEAVAAVGAGRLQQTIGAVVPQSMAAIVGAVVYSLDVNIRSATVLGIVGAGGIGFLLQSSLRLLALPVAGAVIACTFALAFGVELLSGWWRRLVS